MKKSVFQQIYVKFVHFMYSIFKRFQSAFVLVTKMSDVNRYIVQFIFRFGLTLNKSVRFFFLNLNV